MLNSKKSNNFRYFLISALFFLLAFLFFNREIAAQYVFFRKISAAANFVVSVKDKIYNSKIGFYYFNSKKSLLEENIKLKEENEKLKAKSVEQEKLLKENKEFLSMLGRKTERNFILASVAYKPPVSQFDTILIDAGASSGVQRGMKVSVFQSIALGEIDEVFQKTSKVKLYSYEENKINIFIGNSSSSASAVGKGGENFEIILPKDTQASEGDQILTTETSALILGKINKIIKNDSDPFQKIYFRYPVNLNEVRYVEILTE